MATEAVADGAGPSDREPFFTRVRNWGRSRRSVSERVAEAVEERSDLAGEYPQPVSDAVVAGLDRGLRIDPGTALDEHRAIGFGCDKRPTMILVGDPVSDSLAIYRIEVQQYGNRYREMELTVGGQGADRELLKAVAWVEEHPPGEHTTVVTQAEHRMDSVELLRLAGDLDGRVRDDTFREVQRTDGPRR